MNQLPFFGLPVKLCPKYNGDCQFEAAANQLCSVVGLSETSDTCRKRAVEWITAHRDSIRDFVPHSNSPSHEGKHDHLISSDWETYIERMSTAGTYGDSITLQAMANVFNIQWIILSTNSAESCIISKTDIFDPSLPVLILGHDVQRIHYVSLERRADMEDIYLNVRGMNSCVKFRSVYGDGENSTTSPTSTITVQPKCSDFDIPPKVVSYPVGLPTNAFAGQDNSGEFPYISEGGGENNTSTITVQPQCALNASRSSEVSDPVAISDPWPSIWSRKTWNEFKNRYSWLDCRNGRLGCNACSGVYSGSARGIMGQGLMASTEWVTYAVSESATAKDRSGLLASLRNKIKKHGDSIVHGSAEKITAQSNARQLEVALQKQTSDDQKETCAIFRTAYYLAKKNRPYSDQFDLIELQQINGAGCGSSLHSRYSATQIVAHVATEMRKTLVRHIVESNAKFSVIIDESTTISRKSTLCIYVRASVNNDEPVSMFFT